MQNQQGTTITWHPEWTQSQKLNKERRTHQKTTPFSPPPNWGDIEHAGTDTKGTDADLLECQDKLRQRHVKNDNIIGTLNITQGRVAHISVRVLQGQLALCAPFAGSQKFRVPICSREQKTLVCTGKDLGHALTCTAAQSLDCLHSS